MTINQKVFAVHKNYGIGKNNHGAKIRVCRVITFQNTKGEIVPVLRAIGERTEFNTITHEVFANIKEAINHIR